MNVEIQLLGRLEYNQAKAMQTTYWETLKKTTENYVLIQISYWFYISMMTTQLVSKWYWLPVGPTRQKFLEASQAFQFQYTA